jgi:hypothetical protein
MISQASTVSITVDAFRRPRTCSSAASVIVLYLFDCRSVTLYRLID